MHFVKDLKKLLIQSRSILEKNGKIIIITRPAEQGYPFGKNLAKYWKNSIQASADEIRDIAIEQNFKFDKQQTTTDLKISKELWNFLLTKNLNVISVIS